MVGEDVAERKRAARDQVWALLERRGVVPPGVRGHIPDFVGADQAAQRLAALSVWREARVVVANPDRAQLPVRVAALREGKRLYMAVPRLAADKPFYEYDPVTLSGPYEEVVTGAGAAKVARAVDVHEMLPADLFVCGSVVVDRGGGRLGKGAGYTDTEVGLLSEAGLVGPGTTMVTTVHPLQVADEPLPQEARDIRADVIVTSTTELLGLRSHSS